MENLTQLVGIYQLYKLGRMNGTSFSKDIKVLERTLHPVHHEFADASNVNFAMNGLWYEEDKEATKLYWQKKPYEAVKDYAQFEEIKGVEDETSEPLGEGIQINEVQFKLSQMTKDQLIEFAEKNDYKIRKTKSAENILAEIIEQIEIGE